jgi:alpha-L-arabinofuranosidase
MDISSRIDNVTGKLGGSVSVWELNHSDLKAVHTFGDDRKVRPSVRTVTLAVENNGFTYRFPKHSLTILKLQLE